MLQKLILGLLLLFTWCTQAAQATVHITGDRGGRIGDYIEKYRGLRTSGESVVIDGMCASACTIVLGAVAQNKICVTRRAYLGFHAAWDQGTNQYGEQAAITNPAATQLLYSLYPGQVRRWIAQHGGLQSQMIFLQGKQLQSMYKPCTTDANAQYQ